MFTEKEETQIRDMLGLHIQRMKTHALSFQMEGKSLSDPTIKDILAQHEVEANKCRTKIDEIIAKEEL